MKNSRTTLIVFIIFIGAWFLVTKIPKNNCGTCSQTAVGCCSIENTAPLVAGTKNIELPKGKPTLLLVLSGDRKNDRDANRVFTILRSEYENKVEFVSIKYSEESFKIVAKRFKFHGAPGVLILDSKGNLIKMYGSKPRVGDVRDKLQSVMEKNGG